MRREADVVVAEPAPKPHRIKDIGFHIFIPYNPKLVFVLWFLSQTAFIYTSNADFKISLYGRVHVKTVP